MVKPEKAVSTLYWNYLEDYRPSTDGLSAGNVIVKQILGEPINSNSLIGTVPMTVDGTLMDAAAESERNSVKKHQIQPGYGE